QRGAHLAQEERAEPPPAHRAAPASASTRRKTSVIAGCSIETRASGWAATRRASAPRTRASSGPAASATPASVGVAPPPSSAAAAHVDPRRRLVEEEEPRPVHDADREAGALADAGGQVLGLLALGLREREALAERTPAALERRAGEPVEPGVELDVLAQREALV